MRYRIHSFTIDINYLVYTYFEFDVLAPKEKNIGLFSGEPESMVTVGIFGESDGDVLPLLESRHSGVTEVWLDENALLRIPFKGVVRSFCGGSDSVNSVVLNLTLLFPHDGVEGVDEGTAEISSSD